MPAATIELIQETPVRWRIDPRGAMEVPGIVFASKALLPEVVEDRSTEQVANVATLPGIVVASYSMPCGMCTGATAFRSAGWPPPTSIRAGGLTRRGRLGLLLGAR